MAETCSGAQPNKMALAITVALLILVTLVFLGAFVATNRASITPSPAAVAQEFAPDISIALGSASAAEGEELIEAFQCSICHILGDKRVAPRFTGIAERAEARRPPLSAQQYLYESIVHPGAFLVEGYTNAMPGNYADRLSNEEIGHIIAFLLTQ